MTSAPSEHPATASSSIEPRQAVGFIAPVVFVGLGSLIAWQAPTLPIGIALFLLAILSAKLSDRRGYSILVTAGASVCLAIPYILASALPNPVQVLWFACLWIAAALLSWDSTRSIAMDQLEDAFAVSPNGLLLANLNGDVIHANRAVDKLLNASTENAVGTEIQDLIGLEIWHYIQNQITEGVESLTVEFEVQTTDRSRTIEGHVNQIRHQDKPAYYVIQLNDVTEAQSTTQALNLATDQLKQILGVSTDVVFILDSRLNLTYANNRALQLLETTAPNLHKQPIANHVANTQSSGFLKSIKAFRQGNERRITLDAVQFKSQHDLALNVEVVRLGNSSDAGFALICHPAEDLVNSLYTLKTSQARFSQVFHASPDAILIMRAQDRLILDFNEGFTRLLGYRREDAIGVLETDLDFWSNVVERGVVSEQLIADREVIDYETTLKTVGGSLAHIEISIRYIEVDNELCILWIGRDITKRISAEAALVETEEKFEKVFAHSPDGIVVYRQADGVISDLNDKFLTHSGYSKQDLVGQSIFDLPVFDDTKTLKAASGDLDQNDMFANQSVSFIKKSGATVPALISGTLLELSGEGYVMCLAKDMSSQKEAEERLRGSEERFRGIFESAPIGIMLVELDGTIFQANRFAAQLLNYEQDHLDRLHISRLLQQQDRQLLKENLTQLKDDNAAPISSEQRMICQNGAEIWTNSHIVLQRSGDGDPLYYIVQIADITDLKQGQQRMEQMAFYDTLTNLANRRLFHDRLNQSIEHAVRTSRSAALLYLDLDNFKRVNDTLGHEIGDSLLREVAGRLKQCVRKEDTVARPGGDEFTILLNEINTPSDAGMVAEKILNHLREPITISGHPLVVTTSIGITLLPSDGADPNVLTKNADLAMYKAKERGRNNYQFYSEDLNTNAAARLRTEYEIRQALERKEFRLFYQPKVSIKTMEIVGVECLIRWEHPERGMLGPDQFIEVAEETGSIIDIGSWVIDEAFAAAREINGTSETPLHIAINISPRQFRDPNLTNTIRRCIREADMNPEHIELEITETMLMQDAAAAEETVRNLSDLGVRLAIDDFGTGYSSLNYLKRFPINTVKVDKSFVMDIPDNQDDVAITRAVVAMAHQLKMEVVAEGVETREQLEFLADLDCEYAQGYLFSRPIPFDEIKKLVVNNVRLMHFE